MTPGGRIRLEVDAGVATILIEQPSRRNAMTVSMIERLCVAVEDVAARDDVVCCILAGAGDDFCSGADQQEVAARLDGQFGGWLVRRLSASLALLESLPVVSIAAISGTALGGGLELALACTTRIASEDAQLGMIQVQNGLAAAWEGNVRLAEIVGAGRAAVLCASGAVIGARAASNIGLVDEVVPRNDALRSARALAAEISSRPPDVVRAILTDIAAHRSQSRSDSSRTQSQQTFLRLWGSEAHRTATARWRG
jgi:enoyl-CoA hydratase